MNWLYLDYFFLFLFSYFFNAIVLRQVLGTACGREWRLRNIFAFHFIIKFILITNLTCLYLIWFNVILLKFNLINSFMVFSYFVYCIRCVAPYFFFPNYSLWLRWRRVLMEPCAGCAKWKNFFWFSFYLMDSIVSFRALKVHSFSLFLHATSLLDSREGVTAYCFLALVKNLICLKVFYWFYNGLFSFR